MMKIMTIKFMSPRVNSGVVVAVVVATVEVAKAVTAQFVVEALTLVQVQFIGFIYIFVGPPFHFLEKNFI